MIQRFLSNLFLFLPETSILVKIFDFNSHFNDFSLRLQPSKDILVNKSPVIRKRKELVHQVGLPISQKHSVLQDLLWGYFFLVFLDLSPFNLRKSIMRHVEHSCTKLVRSNSFCLFTRCVDIRVGIYFFYLGRLINFGGSAHYFLVAFQSWKFDVTSEVWKKRSLLFSNGLIFLDSSRHYIHVRLN